MKLGPQMANIRVDKKWMILAQNAPTIHKNEKLKNWASPCFKWAQIMPRVKI